MRIVLGSDERTGLTDALVEGLRARGVQVDLVGPPAGDDLAWPEVGHRVGVRVASGAADTGIVCCWTGTGVSIAANKVPGVRAALCGDAATAAGARRWNDANVLALSLRLVTLPLAEEIVEAWLTTAPDPDEAANIAAVEPPDGGR
ncbi:MAG: RpiB/LacA/LacB family sugar-phosphate isomerase [Actinomycetota bacterium]